MKHFALLLMILGTAANATVTVLDDDCESPAGSVGTVNSGTWDVLAAPSYNGSGRMHLSSANAIRSVGEWNPEGDDVYDSAGPNYPSGTPKPVSLSFDWQIDPGLSSAARLHVITRNSDRGSLEARGLKVEIRPNFTDGNGTGLKIDTSASGLANNGDVTGSLETDGTTTGAAVVTGTGFSDDSSNNNQYRITVTDTIDLWTLRMDGTAGPIAGEFVQFEIDLSGVTHKNSDTNPGHNHVWIGSEGGAFELDNILVIVGLSQPVPFSDVVVADALAVELLTELDEVYELQSSTDLLNPNVWTSTGAFITGDGSNMLFFDPAASAGDKHYRVLKL